MPKDNVIRRTDDWKHWKVRETKLLKAFPVKKRRWADKWGPDHYKVKSLIKSININLAYHDAIKS